MQSTPPNFHTVHFDEHPAATPGQTHTEFAIPLSADFSMADYCQALFQKALTIGLSEIADLLDYHCTKVKNPLRWLNSLEKLIKENIDIFDSRLLQHRHTKLISQIDIKRHSLQIVQPQPLKLHKKINGFSDEKDYSFLAVRDHLKTLETHEEKIAFLEDQICDYKQHPPDYVSTKQQPFDIQCALEIERLEKQEKLSQKAEARKNTAKQGKKMPYHGDLKVLCDVFHKLMTKPTPKGSTILPWTAAEATEYICNTLCEADGSPINPATVRTYLTGSRPPKADWEVTLD